MRNESIDTKGNNISLLEKFVESVIKRQITVM